ncbi:PQQ-binding-like beta-propeller repeat protein [bacterium]|nr:PQQ-binding-like beta-propeller repeat protein [bacterium]
MKHIAMAVLMTISSSVFAASWPQFGCDATHKSATYDIAPRDLTAAVMAASAPLGITDGSGIVALGGRVYAFSGASPTSILYCLDAATLDVIWSNTVDVADLGWGSWGTPAVSTSCVVYAAEDFLGCWNLDGSLRWETDIPRTLNSSPVIAGDRVIVGAFSYMNATGGVAACELGTGSQLWYSAVIPNGAFSCCTPAIDEAAGVGYACASNQVWQFSLATGAVTWQTNLPGDSLQNVSLAGGTLLVVNYDFMYAETNLFALNASNGSNLWAGACGMSDVAPAVYAGTVVHSCGDNAVPPALTAFDLATGSNLWTREGYGNVGSMPAISKGYVYAGVGVYAGWALSHFSNAAVVSIADGSVFRAPQDLLGGWSPAIADDALLAANGGTVYAYRWPSAQLDVSAFSASILLEKIARDKAKVKAALAIGPEITNWLGEPITLGVGGIPFVVESVGLVRVKEKGGQLKRATLGIRQGTLKMKMRWSAARQTLDIKAVVSKANFTGLLPYKETDGSVNADIVTMFRAGDYSYSARSTDLVALETKKGKVSAWYKAK